MTLTVIYLVHLTYFYFTDKILINIAIYSIPCTGQGKKNKKEEKISITSKEFFLLILKQLCQCKTTLEQGMDVSFINWTRQGPFLEPTSRLE